MCCTHCNKPIAPRLPRQARSEWPFMIIFICPDKSITDRPPPHTWLHTPSSPAMTAATKFPPLAPPSRVSSRWSSSSVRAWSLGGPLWVAGLLLGHLWRLLFAATCRAGRGGGPTPGGFLATLGGGSWVGGSAILPPPTTMQGRGTRVGGCPALTQSPPACGGSVHMRKAKWGQHG